MRVRHLRGDKVFFLFQYLELKYIDDTDPYDIMDDDSHKQNEKADVNFSIYL